jgi:hypothetical protein
MKKQLIDLTSSDLLDRNVWEHWTENNIEFVRPVDKSEISEESNIGYIVLTDFTLNNRTKYLGFCSPQDTSGLDYIQPVIFTDFGQVEFWRNNDWTEDDKKKVLEKLGLDSRDIFPIVYKTRKKCDNKLYSGTIADFNKSK